VADIWTLAAGTIALRPYVFAFLAVYLVAAVLHLGWRKTLWFTLAGYLIAFLSEFSSIHIGIPYGWYYYIDATRDRELWVAGVPFFDSLSYVFLAYCSFATALLVVSPVQARPRDLVSLETRAIRSSFDVLLLGSLFQVYLDIVIDPVALQGGRWFLGQIYGYREPGVHFGVPISNYAGWWLTSGCMILALQVIDGRFGNGLGNGLGLDQRNVEPRKRPAGVRAVSFRSLFGPALYLAVIAFNLSVTFRIGETLMGATGVLIFVLPTAIVSILLRRRSNRYTGAELAEHLRDYPWSRAAPRGE
jgi:uncharacterized membrane protein